MKRKNTKKAIAAVMFAAVILFTASCQLITTEPSETEGNIIISKDPVYTVAETTEAEATAAATHPFAAKPATPPIGSAEAVHHVTKHRATARAANRA